MGSVDAGEVDDDVDAYTAALQKAVEADAAQDTAEADDPDLDDKEKLSRKQARDGARAQLVAAADAMRKRLADARQREAALTDEQRAARDAQRQQQTDAHNLEQLLQHLPKQLTEYVVGLDTLRQNRTSRPVSLHFTSLHLPSLHHHLTLISSHVLTCVGGWWLVVVLMITHA